LILSGELAIGILLDEMRFGISSVVGIQRDPGGNRENEYARMSEDRKIRMLMEPIAVSPYRSELEGESIWTV
jgi:hypothetical protein